MKGIRNFQIFTAIWTKSLEILQNDVFSIDSISLNYNNQYSLSLTFIVRYRFDFLLGCVKVVMVANWKMCFIFSLLSCTLEKKVWYGAFACSWFLDKHHPKSVLVKLLLKFKKRSANMGKFFVLKNENTSCYNFQTFKNTLGVIKFKIRINAAK